MENRITKKGTNMTTAAVRRVSEKEQNFMNEELDFEFYNIEEPGVMHSFSYGPANNVKSYKLFHGGKYRYPRYLINHIESKGPANWQYSPDGSGNMRATKQGNKPRFQCRIIFSQPS